MKTALYVAAALLTGYPADRLTAQDTVPPGYGTLRRDEIVVRFATGNLEIQVLPLDEDVIRLLTPDTYRSLHHLLQSRSAEIAATAARAAVERPTLALVTFHGLVQGARIDPEELTVTSRGRLFRPIGIVPLSPAWSSYQVDARQQALAIYLFDRGIGFRESVTIGYQGIANDSWTRALRALERERARVTARAQAAGVPTPEP